MDSPLSALRASSGRLHDLTAGMDDARLVSPSYCDDWSIAQVLSHLGSGAVIARRSLEDVRAGAATSDGFNQSVWDEWNAKSPRAQADDALVADRALVDAYEAVPAADRGTLTFPLGPLSLAFDEFVSLRLNEHAFHSWDIAVVLDDAAVLPADVAGVVVDHLSLIARFSGRPDGQDRAVRVHTTDPGRDFSLQVSSEGVVLEADASAASPDLVLPAEAFSRLVYGRLDPDHTPAVTGDSGVLASLRAVFPGP